MINVFYIDPIDLNFMVLFIFYYSFTILFESFFHMKNFLAGFCSANPLIFVSFSLASNVFILPSFFPPF